MGRQNFLQEPKMISYTDKVGDNYYNHEVHKKNIGPSS